VYACEKGGIMKLAKKIKEQFVKDNAWLSIKHIDVYTIGDNLETLIAAKLEPVKDTIADVLATERAFIGQASVADLESLLAMLSEEE